MVTVNSKGIAMAIVPISGWRVVMVPETGIDIEFTSLLGDGLDRSEAYELAFDYHAKQWEDDRPDYYMEVWNAGNVELFEFYTGHKDHIMFPVQYGVVIVFN